MVGCPIEAGIHIVLAVSRTRMLGFDGARYVLMARDTFWWREIRFDGARYVLMARDTF